jgi:hypothetical protein
MQSPESGDNYLDNHRRNNLLPMCPERTEIDLVRPDGFEPPTTWFEACRTVEIEVFAIVTS